jgi:hypothetical protein
VIPDRCRNRVPMGVFHEARRERAPMGFDADGLPEYERLTATP